MLFRTRELLIGQRTQMTNALRGHLAEHGHLMPQGLGNVARLATIMSAGNDLPDLVRIWRGSTSTRSRLSACPNA